MKQRQEQFAGKLRINDYARFFINLNRSVALDRNERKLAGHIGSAEVRLGDSVWTLSDG